MRGVNMNQDHVMLVGFVVLAVMATIWSLRRSKLQRAKHSWVRALLLQVLYSVRSERILMEQLDVAAADPALRHTILPRTRPPSVPV